MGWKVAPKGSPEIGHAQEPVQQVVELGGPLDGERHLARLEDLLGRPLGPVVAVGVTVHAHDGDVEQVGTGVTDGLQQSPGATDLDLLLGLQRRGRVHDGVDPGHGVDQSLARLQIGGVDGDTFRRGRVGTA